VGSQGGLGRRVASVRQAGGGAQALASAAHVEQRCERQPAGKQSVKSGNSFFLAARSNSIFVLSLVNGSRFIIHSISQCGNLFKIKLPRRYYMRYLFTSLSLCMKLS
jgi:hypothetical protein